MKNKLNPNNIIFSLNLKDSEEEKLIDLMDIKEFKTPYDKIKRILKIKKENYNLYLVDSYLKEKVNKLVEIIEKEYEKLEAPKDICYASLSDDEKPFPITLSNGRGKALKEDIAILKEEYKDALLEFNDYEFTDEKDNILEDLKVNRSKYLNKLMTLAADEGFEMKVTRDGFVFIPLKDGKEMTEEEYDLLEEDFKDELLEKAEKLKSDTSEIIEAIKTIEIKELEKLKEILGEYLENRLKEVKEDLLLEYILDDDVYNYLDAFYKKIEKELIGLYTVYIDEDEKEVDKILGKYEIEIIVDNTEYNNPRVIFEEDPTITRLLGNIEYESQNGNYTTDLSLINAGTLLEANEGCIIVRVKDLLINNTYPYLKKVLLTQSLNFDANRNYLEVLSINGLKVQGVGINVKIILIGDYETFNILYSNDEDFKLLFPIKVDFKSEIDIDKNLELIYGYIKDLNLEICELKIDKKGIEVIIKYLSRVAENKNKIIVDHKEIERILLLSEQIAYDKEKEIIDSESVREVIYEEDIIEESYLDMYDDGKIIINLEGKKVGNINGLAVLDTGTHAFGKPMRITCNVFKGEGSIVDIHKDAKLSGRIHEKSIGILKSILYSKWDKKSKLPINIHLNFEQNYGMIEGDSASVAEMICMLSAITGKGVKQNIAVTGSLNQFSEVQPIGGVNEKIEGFYKVCVNLDKNKGAGVLIPKTNISELILNEDVEESIKKDEFSLYYMETLDEAIEILLLEEGETIEEFYKLLTEKISEYKK